MVVSRLRGRESRKDVLGVAVGELRSARTDQRHRDQEDFLSTTRDD